jgi:hypothetical protein
MDTTSIPPRGGCRFIAGEPRDFHTRGEAIYCRRPVAREGGSWCAAHEAVVFITIEEIREARRAA